MIIFVTLITLIIDLFSKYIIKSTLEVSKSITVIKDFFNITYIRNTGAAFSILNNNTYIIIMISIIIIFSIIIYVYKNKPKNKLEKLSFGFIIGGSIGNFLDRIIYGYVIDFLDFNVFGYNYPVFNLADTFIVLGVILLIISTWRYNDGRNKSNRK